MSKDDGGAAFPLRDWFAGQALAGIMTNTQLLGKASRESGIPVPEGIAMEVYAIADAMLAARMKGPSNE